ncbi:MAG: glycosyltransferase family 1 protein [Oscillatoria sp. SIO1A7]|nr:glycosyltransferase family 1 protein [Oscillatoria sp. SIO1A7]
MHIGFLNPQGNFDSKDSYWTYHPDFGGQLVYVKQVAVAMAAQGHKVDILTRQIIDPDWPEFAERLDRYLGVRNLRIIRLPAGPERFLRKELLWPHLVSDWVPNILQFYRDEGSFPDAMTAHYGDGGLSAVLIEDKTGIPFTFTGHSLGAQKMDKLEVTRGNLGEIDEQYNFGCRIMAERLSMNRSALNITSTRQERFKQYGHRAYRGAVNVEDNSRFAVIPPGSNLAVFSSNGYSDNEMIAYEHVQECLFRDLAVGRGELPAIVAASRLDLKKNHLGLVEAFAYSEKLQSCANLVMITGGLEDPLRNDADARPSEQEVLAGIRDVVKENNLWGKVSAFSVGSQAYLAATYRLLASRRSVFALTALYEPFGLAPLEAAAAGLPVVVTKNGGPSESLSEGNEEYGVLVDPADPADIARGLERVLCNSDEWDKFAKQGQKRVLSRYTWDRTAEGYLTQLEKIIAARPTEPAPERLPIHAYFCKEDFDNEIGLDELSKLYF